MNQVTAGQVPNFSSWQNNTKLLQQSDKFKYRKILNSQLHYFRNIGLDKRLDFIFESLQNLADEGNCLHVINLNFEGIKKRLQLSIVLHPFRKR